MWAVHEPIWAVREPPLQVTWGRPRGHDRIVEQHRSGHRADASRDGGDPGRPWLDLIEAHVPDEPSSFLPMDADIDDDRVLSDVLGADHLPLSGGDDEDVGPPGDLGKVPRTRVADRNGRVLAQEKLCERLAPEVRAP